MSKRNFTIEESNVGYTGGLYKSSTPQAAAKKAASVLFRVTENKKNKPEWRKYERKVSKVVFTIRETTNGSLKKEFSYSGKKEKLSEPIVFFEGEDNEYTIDYKIIIQAN